MKSEFPIYVTDPDGRIIGCPMAGGTFHTDERGHRFYDLEVFAPLAHWDIDYKFIENEIGLQMNRAEHIHTLMVNGRYV
jgi:hypothetical protein